MSPTDCRNAEEIARMTFVPLNEEARRQDAEDAARKPLKYPIHDRPSLIDLIDYRIRQAERKANAALMDHFWEDLLAGP